MELKRKQDQEKIIEDSKYLQHVKNVAKRLELKLAPMHKEIKELRSKLQELEAENSALAEDAIKTEEFLEMSALDKEMAEEKYENIVLELEELKKNGKIWSLNVRLYVRKMHCMRACVRILMKSLPQML